MTDVTIIKAKLAADQVADNCLLAHFTASEPVAQKYHIGEADHHFRHLAGLLGYDVTKRTGPREPDAADKLALLLAGPLFPMNSPTPRA